MRPVSLVVSLVAATLAGPLAFAAEPAPPAAATGQPTLEQIATDGIRTCMSIAEGRTPADAASVFGFTADATDPTLFVRDVDRGRVTVQPPTADRRSCRTSLSALTLDNEAVIEAVKTFLTTPPQFYASLQSRVGEAIGGGYAARVSIWAQSDGINLGQVTLYEIVGDEYYKGPKIMIDHLVDRR